VTAYVFFKFIVVQSAQIWERGRRRAASSGSAVCYLF